MTDQNSNTKRDPKMGRQQGRPEYLKVEDITKEDTLCCCPPVCAPSWFQFLANPKIFVVHMMVVVSFTMMAFVYIGAVLTTIERNFRLDSAQSGAITISADIVSTLFVIPLSHFGQMGHRPRWVGTGMIVTAIGTFLCAMPHFVSDPINPQTIVTGSLDKSQDLCVNDDGSDSYSATGTSLNSSHVHDGSGNHSSSKGDLSSVWWLILGQIVSGIGHAPFVPLVITYIDDSVKKHNLTAYSAVLFVAFTIGPSCGFLFGAFATSLYVDFDRVPKDQIPNIHQYDPRWIGAWWLGFVILSIILVILSIPIFFYPRTMPSAVRKWTQEKEKAEAAQDLEKSDKGKLVDADAQNGISPLEVKGNKEEEADYDEDDALRQRRGSIYTVLDGNAVESVIKGPFRALKRLVTNPTNMALVLDELAFVSLIAIFAAFGVKYIEEQYSTSPSEAAFIVAVVLGPSNIVGNIFSAVICRRFKFNSKQCSLFVMVAAVLSLFLYPVAMTLGCDNVPIAGVTTTYDGQVATSAASSISNECNEHCACSDELFEPICGSNGLTYLSPCHAGCQMSVAPSNNSNAMGNPFFQQREYTGCSCIGNTTFFLDPDLDAQATAGQCPQSDCRGPIPVAIILSLLFFFHATTSNPMTYIALRCVREEDRSMAIALRSVSAHFLGFFPAPIYFGAIINSVCLHWQVTDGQRGSCYVYDNRKYELAYFGSAMALQAVAVIAVIWMFLSIDEKLFTKKPRSDKEYDKIKKQDMELATENH